MVYVYVETSKGKFQDVRTKIHNRKLVISSANQTLNEIYLNLQGTGPYSKKYKEIKDALQRMRGVETVKEIPAFIDTSNTKLKDALAINNCRFILDIDSTITRGGAGTIHHSIPPILKKMKDRGIWVYVATGRSLYDLTNLISKNPIQPHSIAENGGIILGFAKDGYLEWGNKDEPRKVLEYIQRKYKKKEDMEQGERITEVIFSQREVSEEQLNEAISATDAKVKVHKSQNSYHISAENIDKGSAVLELASRMKWGNSFKIAVGDSQLDVPMFEACEYSFAPKNCDEHARSACSQVLNSRYEKCMAEIYDLIVKSD